MLLSALWSRLAPYVLGAGVILVAVATFGWSQRRAGRAEAKAEIQTHTMEIKDAQQEAAASAPRGRDAVADSLRSGNF